MGTDRRRGCGAPRGAGRDASRRCGRDRRAATSQRPGDRTRLRHARTGRDPEPDLSHRMPTPTRAAVRTTALLVRASHPGPALAVTTVVLLLALSGGLPPPRTVAVVLAVFTGQLTIGWSNDLLDARRDRATGRRDKPVATGDLAASAVVTALVVAGGCCVVLSLLVGWRSALVHLGLGVASGHLYNLVLKRSVWSWLPYAVAFGTLPAVVTLADVPPRWPPAWML